MYVLNKAGRYKNLKEYQQHRKFKECELVEEWL
jgi:hypothetical protein